MKNLKVYAKLQQMAQGEILAIVDPVERQRIESSDRHPEYRVYKIGYEGETVGGRIIHYGETVLSWAASAVRQLHDKLQLGTSFFHLHNHDNSTSGRIPVGRVVGKMLKAGAVLAVAYILPEFRSKKLDAASMEADIQINSLSGDGKMYHTDDFEVINITGIALGDSAFNKPAFPDAGLLASVALFAKGETMITIDDVREFLSDAANKNIAPSDLFPTEVLLTDPEVKANNRNEYNARKRVETEHNAKLKERDDKIAALEAEKVALSNQVKSMNADIIKVELPGMAKEIITSRKLDEKAARYLEKNLGKFVAPEDGKKKEAFVTFVDGLITEFEDIRKDVFGETAGKPDERDVGDQRRGETPATVDELTPPGLIIK